MVIKKAISNIGLKVRDIVLKDNKFVHHLKNLYNIIFLEEINKSISIDRVMEYEVKKNNNNKHYVSIFYFYINWIIKYKLFKKLKTNIMLILFLLIIS